LVPVKRREPAAVRHAELIEYKGRSLYLRRHPEKQRCAALAGPPEGPYGCTIYHDRPSTCRDFSAGSTSCLDARRRVGLESGPGR
jgi:Fe-S-cluster containining protein